ncbi:MAG: cyclase family protein [bacterium]
MVFHIDFTKYRLVDLSRLVIPNQPEAADRPFLIQESFLPDRTCKFDIQTHSHVGTHVESPWHFYRAGKSISDFPLEKFMGRCRMLRAVPAGQGNSVTLEFVRDVLEPLRGQFEILLVRNDSAVKPIFVDLKVVEYLQDFNLQLLVFTTDVHFGRDMEEGRRFHELLMSREVCLVEIPAQCEELGRDDFYLFAAPMRVQGLDSAMCRLFAVVER